MDDILLKVDELIESSNNIPDRIKPIVKAICKGYIRESNGKIPIEGIVNVCNTTFVEKDENDISFSGEERHFAETETHYDEQCNIIHKVEYLNYSDYIKLISILVHELGHVITESKPCSITKDGVYPIAKRTTTFYYNCQYQDGVLMAKHWYGYRMADGFLESICTKIFESSEFRQELLNAGFDLKDFVYKDERIFPSRIYDEYKACFELYDYIMNGALFDFSCMTFNSNQELFEYINKYKLPVIFTQLDKSNDALYKLKTYEGKEADEAFNMLLKQYKELKDVSIEFADVLRDIYQKSREDEQFNYLLDNYTNSIKKNKSLPLPEELLSSSKKI